MISCFFLTQVDKLLNAPRTFRTTSLDQATNASFHIPSKSLPINRTSIRRNIRIYIYIYIYIYVFGDIKTVNNRKATS